MNIREKLLNKPAYFIIILSTLLSYRYVYNTVIYPKVEWRIQMQSEILEGSANPPYQYRVFKPLLGLGFQKVISIFVKQPVSVHLISYQIIIFLTFLGIYSAFYVFLKIFFTDTASIIGLLLMQVLIPLSITSQWQEGDFYNLLFYIIGLLMIFKGKDIFLPLLIGLAVTNREQIIFLVVFYIAYLVTVRQIFKLRSILIIILCFITFGAVYFLIRYIYGFKADVHTIAFNVSSNISVWFSISRLWTEMVLVFVILSILSFKKSGMFFRLSFLSLGLYVVLFFLNGIMGELAKFLPAYLIMIPMSLQVLTGEYHTDRLYSPSLHV